MMKTLTHIFANIPNKLYMEYALRAYHPHQCAVVGGFKQSKCEYHSIYGLYIYICDASISSNDRRKHLGLYCAILSHMTAAEGESGGRGVGEGMSV